MAGPVRRRLPPFTSLTAPIAALLVAVSTSGCTDGRAPTMPTSVVIGVLADTSSTGLRSGRDAIRGAELAVDLVNNTHPELSIPLAAGAGLPGLGGATLTLVTGDTRGDAREVADTATALIAAHRVAALVVADVADVAAAAGGEAQRLAVPVIDAASTADFVTELGLDWYFRVGPTDRMLAETAFAVLRRQVGGPAKIALLGADGPANAAMAALVSDLAARSADTIVTGLIDSSRCDAVLALAGTAAEATEAVRLTSDLPTPLPVLGLGPGFDGLDRLDGVDMAPGTQPPAVLRAAPWSADLAGRSPVGRAVAELYRKRFGVPMTVAAATSFTATMAAALAVDAAGTTDPAATRGALRRLSVGATQIIMPWNGLRFDAHGQNELAAGVIEGWAGNRFRVVYPRELAAGPMIWSTQGVSAR